MSANELSATLWRQRELLEILLFKYEEQHMILAAGKTRWAPHASREIEVVVGRLGTANVATSIAISAVARDWGLAGDVLLRDLVDAAPDPVWKDILTAHIDAVIELITEIRSLREASSREPADEIPGVPSTYTASGTPDHTISTARLIDASL
ncbi:MAG: hypothetical protein QOF36_1968 [Microbacteriaceae bacterium]|jgi:hypothetical protein|nr:hypothetical protein [Microbacteriaceae bacterium]